MGIPFLDSCVSVVRPRRSATGVPSFEKKEVLFAGLSRREERIFLRNEKRKTESGRGGDLLWYSVKQSSPREG
jgi:hypothetical protein